MQETKMAALPYTDRLVGMPIQWSNTVAKTTMQAGSYVHSITVGIKPWREVATLTWRLPKAEAAVLYSQLKTDMFNGVYDYTCDVRGAMKIRPTETASIDERYGGQYVQITLEVENLSL